MSDLHLVGPDPEIAARFDAHHRSRLARVGGLDLHFTEWNPGGTRTVLLIHGMIVQCHTWDPFALELSKRGYHVLAVDLRGHGRSDWSRAGYSVRDFATDLAGLLRAVGVARCAVVGHSLGARVAIALAGDHPELVDRVVLSDAGPEFPAAAIEYADRVVLGTNAIPGFDDAQAAFDFYRAQHPEWQPEFWHLHATHQLRRNWASKLVYRADPDLVWLLSSAGREDDPYVWDRVDRISAPTLILWGQRSPFFDESIARRMLDRLHDGRLERTDTGHFIPREAPEEFLRLAAAFLQD